MRYRRVHRCLEGFCTRFNSCKGSMNQVIAIRLICSPRWCDDCHSRRELAIEDVHRIYRNEVYKQAEWEGWSTHMLQRTTAKSDAKEE